MRTVNSNDRNKVDDGRSVTIRLASDGRVFLHDLTPDLLPIICQLCPNDEVLRQRLHAADQLLEDTQ